MKIRSIAVLCFAEIATMSLWFVSAAVLPDMLAESPISQTRQALLSSAVQAGFVAGAITSAALGLADRYDPRRVLLISALAAALVNASLLVAPIGSAAAIAARFATGALLAGVYPVGMKIAAGWGKADRGFLISLLVGALTLGSASPHLASLLGGADWRIAVAVTSLAAAAGGLAILFAGHGPYHVNATRFDPSCILTAWTDRRIRLAYAGYLGHQWELYAMWAWIGVASSVSYSASLPNDQAIDLAKLTAFLSIGLGGLACVVAGFYADKFGKAETTIIAMVASGACALLTAATFGGPAWLTFALILLWGITIVPDSAQFSTLVADSASPETAGSLLALQTALGFALTIVTVQGTPVLAAVIGWPPVLVIMGLGPLFGVVAMERLRRLLAAQHGHKP